MPLIIGLLSRTDIMKLLVTGGAGFIGSNLIRHVIDYPEISSVVNLDCLTYAGNQESIADFNDSPNYNFAEVDLRDKQSVTRVVEKYDITHVMHLAAESHVDRSIVGPAEFIETNIVGTFNLIESCRKFWGDSFPGKRFLHVSTDEVYGSLGAEGLFTEDTPYAPSSPYSASKASSDMLVKSYYHTYNFPAVITNCSNNYGPYQYPEKLIPVVIHNIVNRQPIPIYGDGMNVRDWLYVLDHVQALWEVLNSGKNGETYNIGGNSEWANLRIVKLICDIIDDLAPHLGGNSSQLIKFVPDRPGHDRRYAIDATKIKRELGWEPEYTFEHGIRETVEWYLKNDEWVSRAMKK